MRTLEPPLKKRIFLVAGVILIQSIYTPTSLFLTGGIEPKLPIDIFPLWVVWVIPYALCYLLWTIALIWMIWKMDESMFRKTVTGLFFACTLGISIFILFPTYVVQPELHGTDILSNILRSIQIAGGDHDALPSAHIYTTVVFALFYHEWYPRYKRVWLSMVVIVSLSTLFTKQHYIADVLAGYLTGWLGYRFGAWWYAMDGKIKQRRMSHV